MATQKPPRIKYVLHTCKYSNMMHYSNRAVTLIEQSLAYAPVIIQHEAVRCNQPLRNCSALYEGQPVCIYTCMYVMCKCNRQTQIAHSEFFKGCEIIYRFCSKLIEYIQNFQGNNIINLMIRGEILSNLPTSPLKNSMYIYSICMNSTKPYLMYISSRPISL